MKKLAIVALVLPLASFLAAQDPSVEEAIDQLAATYEEAWKNGDAAAAAAVYAPDADVVDFYGNSFQGREAIQNSIGQTLSAYPNTTIDIQRTGLHAVTPDLVVADGRWEVSGAAASEGTPTQGFYSVILARGAEGWQILAGRTKVPPPMPASE